LSALYRFFRSIRLAVTLILILAALSILSTLIPQGKDAAFYFHTYGPFWAQVIMTLDLHDLFRSLLFLIPVGLFFVNLSVCGIDRLVSRERRRARRRHGPDLIHIGLLLLIIAAMFSVFGRVESLVYMGEGDEIRLKGQYQIRLVDYEYEQYEDGRPKDWISTVEVRRNGELLIPSFAIEVNKPLRIAGIRIYQTSFAREDRALLRDKDGIDRQISNGQGFEVEGAVVIFRGIEGGTAVFEEWKQHTRTAIHRIGIGRRIGEYTIADLGARDVTGLKAVKDPGFVPVVVALTVVAAGLTLTFVQKRKDREL
jgi:cytochrome c biogenesis protein ResB